jgi:hypothetical protein
MDSARIGYCCTFVSPEGDAAEERALNFRGPTISLVARQGAARLGDTKNLASRQLADDCRAELLPA